MYLQYIIVALFGLALGSFANVLIDRLPKRQDVIRGRSKCDSCHTTLRAYELIPILSFFIQHRRCRTCACILSWQYPLVESITAIGLLVIFVSVGVFDVFFIALTLLWLATVVTCGTDIKYFIIPDSMIVLSACAFLLLVGEGTILRSELGMRVVTAFASAFLFGAVYRVTKGKGMGLGDVKLVAATGLLLGHQLQGVALYLAFLTGALVGVILILGRKKSIKSKIPFGPFIIVAAWAAAVGSKAIFAWWQGFMW